MKLIKLVIILALLLGTISSKSQDLVHYQKVIPELIKATFVEKVNQVELDDRGNLTISFEKKLTLSHNVLDIEMMVIEEIKHFPSIRFECRENYHCLKRYVKGKLKPWKYTYFNWKFNSLSDAEKVKEALEGYKSVVK